MASTSTSRWLETNTVVPSSANRRSNRRMSRIPWGSSPFIGSLRATNSGLAARARGPRRERRVGRAGRRGGGGEPLAHPLAIGTHLLAGRVGEIDDREHL